MILQIAIPIVIGIVLFATAFEIEYWYDKWRNG